MINLFTFLRQGLCFFEQVICFFQTKLSLIREAINRTLERMHFTSSSTGFSMKTSEHTVYQSSTIQLFPLVKTAFVLPLGITLGITPLVTPLRPPDNRDAGFEFDKLQI